MAEDTADHENEELIAGLEKGDLKPNFYEGGFKTWECSLDLAKLIANETSIIESLDDSQTNVHIIEVRIKKAWGRCIRTNICNSLARVQRYPH